MAAERRWDFVVVGGDPRLLDAFESGFGTNECEIVRSNQFFAGMPVTEMADRVAATLHELRKDVIMRLVARLESSGAATIDLAVVEQALEEGRVEHLLLAYPEVSTPAAAMESLLRRAFNTGAEVTLIDPDTLGRGDVAALLRW